MRNILTRKVACDKSVFPTFYFQHHDKKVKRIIVNVIRPIFDLSVLKLVKENWNDCIYCFLDSVYL